MIGNQSGATRAGIGFPLQRSTGEELTRLVLRPPDWTAAAACQRHDPGDWHSPNPGRQRRARAVCTGCPVRHECALAALESGEPHGLWGGLSVDDRRTIAATYGYPRPNAARHGTRSRYVAGCSCTACKRAHAHYEHQRRLGKGEAQPEHTRYALTRGREESDGATPAAPTPPSSADARFLVDVEAAELGIEHTVSSDETLIELGRMVCRADAAGMSEADLRDVLTGAGLSLRQASALLTAARAAYGSQPAEPAHARRRTRRRRRWALTAV